MNKARWLEAAELSCGPSIGSQTWQTGIRFVPGTFRCAKMLRRVYRAYQIRVRYQPRAAGGALPPTGLGPGDRCAEATLDRRGSGWRPKLSEHAIPTIEARRAALV